MTVTKPCLALTTLLVLAGLACGSEGRDAAVQISPQPALVKVGEKVLLAAAPLVDLKGEPQWEVQELNGGALLKGQGMSTTYVAPQAAGTYHVTVRGFREDGSTFKQLHDIQVLPVIQVDPAQISVKAGSSVALQVRVRGLSKQEVQWAVEEDGGGSVNAHGIYQAPHRPGTYHVSASSKEFWGAVGSATIRVE